jgi:hypothetical protein
MTFEEWHSKQASCCETCDVNCPHLAWELAAWTAAIASRDEEVKAERAATLLDADSAYESHEHVSQPDTDICRTCREDLRHAIHLRVGETRQSRIAALVTADSQSALDRIVAHRIAQVINTAKEHMFDGDFSIGLRRR